MRWPVFSAVSLFLPTLCGEMAGVLHLAMWRAGTRALQWSDRKLAVSFPAEVGLALGMDIDMVLRQASIDWHAGAEPDVRF